MTIPLVPANLWQFLGPTLNKPYIPFPAQLEAIQAIKIPWPGPGYPTIFGLNSGRRFGKTTVGEKLLWHGLIAPDDQFGPPTVRLTADTEEHGRKIWDRFIWHLENTPLKALLQDYNRERNLVTLTTGATAQLLSANNPAALSGDGVTLWIIDEAQFLSQQAWDNLFPSTAERDGIIVMLGVSQGDGPFREVCWKGDSPDHPEYMRLAYPTSANPYVPTWRIEFAARTLAPSLFKQLYLAQWADEVGKIFRGVEVCILPDLILEDPTGYFYTSPPLPGHYYYGGLDLGRLQDWTVYTIWNRAGHLVAWDRFNQTSWELLKTRIGALSRKYGYPLTIVDSTGIGDPVFEDLQKRGLKVEGYAITTNARKRALIDELAIRIGAGSIGYPRIPKLLEELTRFESKKSLREGSNVITYQAPAGGTDDFVLSAALAMRTLPVGGAPYNPQGTGEEDFRQVGVYEAI